MKQLPPRRSSLFLMELLIAILFFALASAICVRLFAQAHQMSDDAAQLHMAVIQAQNVEEAVSGCSGNLDDITALFPHASLQSNEMTVYYNDAWEVCTPDAAAFILQLSLTGDLLREGEILISSLENEEIIYQLPVACKIPATYTLEGH